MSDPYKKPYVESSVFIAYIKGETTQGPNHDQDAKAIFDSIIDAAKAGSFKIITSGLTIAEVFKNKKNPPLTIQENEDLRPYFREDYIQIAEVDRDVGDRANELCRTLPADPTTGAKAMRPNDAIHIAAAERAECDVILAWDPDFTSQAPRLSTVRLENPQRLHVAPVAEQSPIAFKNGEQSESTTGSEPEPAAEQQQNNQREADSAHSPAVQGSDGGRAQGETAKESQDEPLFAKVVGMVSAKQDVVEAEKNKGAESGVQSRTTPSS